MRLAILLFTAAVPPAVAGPFNIVRDIEHDELVDAVSTAPLGESLALVINGIETPAIAALTADPVGAEAVPPLHRVALRTPGSPRVAPLSRPAPLSADLLDFAVPVDVPDEREAMDLIPTPGSLALLGAGGLGFISRRGQ
jgi:hypothetical protein